MFNKKKIEELSGEIEALFERITELKERQEKTSIQLEELRNEVIVLKYKNEN